jgi:TonB family protein
LREFLNHQLRKEGQNMRRSHRLGTLHIGIALFLSLALIALGTITNAQQPANNPSDDRDRGIQLYKQGETAAAIKILKKVVKKHSDDADAWYYLALAYWTEGEIGEARPAFERLIMLRPESPAAHAKLAYSLILANDPIRALIAANRAIALGDQSAESHYAIAEASFRSGDNSKAIDEANLALQIKPDFGPALITKSLVHRALGQHAEAAASLERLLAITPADPDSDVWRKELDSLRRFGQQASEPPKASAPTQLAQDRPMSGRDVSVKARILSKPEPRYTEAARRAGVNGTIVIRCIFASDGEVKTLVVMRALAFGLTSEAVEAARKIRFVPAN